MNYRFERSDLDPTDVSVWRGEVIDNLEGNVVVEVWNNGDNGGNFYVWHDADARWAIEDEALRAYTGDDETKMDYYRQVDIVAPMDAWIEELRNG